MGTKTRSVRCANTSTSSEIYVDDHFCLVQNQKPVLSVNCTEACNRWNTGPFGECDDASCKMHRAVVCQNSTGGIIDERHCQSNNRPTNVHTCCHFKWRAKWSQVSFLLIIEMFQIYKRNFTIYSVQFLVVKE